MIFSWRLFIFLRLSLIFPERKLTDSLKNENVWEYFYYPINSRSNTPTRCSTPQFVRCERGVTLEILVLPTSCETVANCFASKRVYLFCRTYANVEHQNGVLSYHNVYWWLEEYTYGFINAVFAVIKTRYWIFKQKYCRRQVSVLSDPISLQTPESEGK